MGGIQIERLFQYALRFRSDVDVIVQYGRMDITQPNLAYIGAMAFAGN
ncbi:MAG: sensory rhodopsin transducer [Candidatus Humimicrobiaceae bacterium]